MSEVDPGEISALTISFSAMYFEEKK